MGRESMFGFMKKKEKFLPIDSQKDIPIRADGNPGAMAVLNELAAEGSGVYSAVAPNLGKGSEVFKKYEECGRNMHDLVNKYSGGIYHLGG